MYSGTNFHQAAVPLLLEHDAKDLEAVVLDLPNAAEIALGAYPVWKLVADCSEWRDVDSLAMLTIATHANAREFLQQFKSEPARTPRQRLRKAAFFAWRMETSHVLNKEQLLNLLSEAPLLPTDTVTKALTSLSPEELNTLVADNEYLQSAAVPVVRRYNLRQWWLSVPFVGSVFFLMGTLYGVLHYLMSQQGLSMIEYVAFTEICVMAAVVFGNILLYFLSWLANKSQKMHLGFLEFGKLPRLAWWKIALLWLAGVTAHSPFSIFDCLDNKINLPFAIFGAIYGGSMLLLDIVLLVSLIHRAAGCCTTRYLPQHKGQTTIRPRAVFNEL
jgi:hypothetical protein